ncbi:MAG TPA: hypothetical protein VKQ30_23210 [Ktedonobacterales bacterium]|nr:hypothetical protein [Ktedonobacterales bacterium]
MDIHGKPSQRWDEMRESDSVVWQPIMLISPERLECNACGAKAIFLFCAVDAQGDICDGQAYCQPCYQRWQGAPS